MFQGSRDPEVFGRGDIRGGAPCSAWVGCIGSCPVTMGTPLPFSVGPEVNWLWGDPASHMSSTWFVSHSRHQDRTFALPKPSPYPVCPSAACRPSRQVSPDAGALLQSCGQHRLPATHVVMALGISFINKALSKFGRSCQGSMVFDEKGSQG